MAESVNIPQVFTSARRYYLGKRLEARRRLEFALEATWRAKQEAEPSTPLAEDFPSKATLETAGYTTQEDLFGATQDELIWAGLSTTEATRVMSELAKL